MHCPVNCVAPASLSAILLLAAACGSSPSTPSGLNGGPACDAVPRAGTMTATIDGVTSSGADVAGRLNCRGTSPPVTDLSLRTNLTGSALEIRITAPLSGGIQPVTFPATCEAPQGTANAYLVAPPFAQWTAGCLLGSGSIALSSWVVPSSVPGSATGERTITGGSFDVTF